MVYSYDEQNKQIKLEQVPKLQGAYAKRVEDSKVPTSFLKSVMAMNLNIKSA